MTDPTFLGIGAQKSGTTWISVMLRKHPEVYVPKKEIHYFDLKRNYKKGVNWYKSQFATCYNEKAIGEFTPNYFWVSSSMTDIRNNDTNPNIPKLVYELYPNINLIVCLRNPVDRAISAFYHHIHARRISPRANILEVGHRYGIISMGFYYHHLTEWLKYFSIKQFLILIYENAIVKNRRETIEKIYDFICVDKEFVPRTVNKRYNSTPSRFFIYINYYNPFIAKIIFNKLPVLHKIHFPFLDVSYKEKKELYEIYTEESKKLADLLGYSIKKWTYK